MLTVSFFHSKYLAAQTAQVKDFKVTIGGTSTMHDWESTIEKLECKTSYKIKDDKLINIEEAILKIAVKSIKSTNGKIMDNKTYDAFDSDQHPFIVFTLKSEKINLSKSTLHLTGTLAMAGITNSIDLVASYKILPNGDFQIVGNKNVNMSDYKMTPPRAMMGTIKVGNKININFDITFSDTPSLL
jgi:polyisoprenoid-binding protein YceI